MMSDKDAKDFQKQVDKLTEEKRTAEGELSQIKGINFSSDKQKEINDLKILADQLTKRNTQINARMGELFNRVLDLTEVSNSHQISNGKLQTKIRELEERIEKGLKKMVRKARGIINGS